LTSSPPSSGLSPAVPSECSALPGGNRGQGLRSLRDLTQHLTTRADDSHAAPLLESRRKGTSLHRSPAVQTQVRFFALRRIEPHAPPLVRAPVNSFEFQPCDRTPLAPLAFAPQRQYRSREPPSPPVFLPISTHFTATLGIPLPSPGLKPCSIFRSSTVELWDFTKDLRGRLRALYAQ